MKSEVTISIILCHMWQILVNYEYVLAEEQYMAVSTFIRMSHFLVHDYEALHVVSTVF